MRKKLIFVFIFLCVLALSNSSYAATAEELMHNYLTKGYQAAREENREMSQKHFRKAAVYARRANKWNGMIDAGSGMLVLGKYDEAMQLFDRAAKIIKREKDWRGKVALAYVYLSMPEHLINKDNALSCFESARLYALEKNDWRGLIESAKGFLQMNATDKALSCVDSAEKIARELKSADGMIAAAKYYKKIGQPTKSWKAMQLSNRFKIKFQEPEAPLHQWKAAGETVAGPKAVSRSVQIAEKETADAEISSAHEYRLRLARNDQKQKSYYLNYNYYYNYPYYYRYYYNHLDTTYLPSTYLRSWSNYYLSRYRRRSGLYYYVGW